MLTTDCEAGQQVALNNVGTAGVQYGELLPTTWGVRAIRESVLGGDPPVAIGACLILGACYLGLAAIAVRRFEVLARRRASLALA